MTIPDFSFGQILQACIVAALISIGRSLWSAGLAFERIKSWADNHEKMDDVRFNNIISQLDRLNKYHDHDHLGAAE